MKKKVIVLSLGGSQIIPDKINLKFINEFKKTILKNKNNYKFIIVCGGGNLARKYISALKGKPFKTQSAAGISATRSNAKFMSCFFSQNPLQEIPIKINKLKKQLKKQDIVFCGALEFKPKQTTDSNAAEIAEFFKTELINITNVQGLYNKDPKKHKNAKFISKIGWKDFDKIANKIKFKPGQHFVLDQAASEIVSKNKITTYILGKNLSHLDKLLKGKKFKGTTIQG